MCEIKFSLPRRRGTVAESAAMVLCGRKIMVRTLRYRHGEGGLFLRKQERCLQAVIAGRIQRETPRFNEIAETAGLDNAFAGPVNAVSGSKSATGSRPRPPLLVGCGGHEHAFLPGNGIGGCFLPSAKSGVDDIGVRLRRNRECSQ